jgi:thymidylate synthase (FAD)
MINKVSQLALAYKPKDRFEVYRSIADAGHVCYRAEGGDPEAFVKKLIKWGHESVLEHESVSFDIRTSRAMLAELTRHRLASYSVESTRYVNYESGLFVVLQERLSLKADSLTLKACEEAYKRYKELLDEGFSAQVARDVLPLCTATNIRMTANIREWRHITRLRTSKAAHPQMRDLMGMIYRVLEAYYPALFEDIVPYEE